mmetsp:Transcript_43375/g.114225  ORF Transcript_43375/g.114225 Transcript_43375/m.114225 type:complete len:380 (-) Transcript_43375:447-1586(-)|eukprot:CAMPEP_0194504186 /NCGR_PEP_ID=MMETSP0253-20130528/28802_1 /TAXON_ID=2966 /ORGANISM="Noctiluca scintillans" /LENGTH=379 /DNA_ID=CAMNT_0039346555 /DNA_START=30 /DNA_END=1169 /DNA_ORIENTATION=-
MMESCNHSEEDCCLKTAEIPWEAEAPENKAERVVEEMYAKVEAMFAQEAGGSTDSNVPKSNFEVASGNSLNQSVPSTCSTRSHEEAQPAASKPQATPSRRTSNTSGTRRPATATSSRVRRSIVPTTHSCPVGGHLEQLERKRAECEGHGLYEEAELAKVQISELKVQEEGRRCEELHSQQMATRLGVDEAHMNELHEFHDVWDRKVAEYEDHARKLQAMLAERHLREHEAYLDKLEREVEPRAPRWSRHLLNLRRVQETLAKQKRYSEAAVKKGLADDMEASEQVLWKDKRDMKIQSLSDQFLTKQELEAKGLEKRIHSGREEQKHSRASELERLLLRYHNVKTQLQSQQRIVSQRVEKHPLLNSFMNGSPSNAAMRGA